MYLNLETRVTPLQATCNTRGMAAISKGKQMNESRLSRALIRMSRDLATIGCCSAVLSPVFEEK